MTIKIKNQEKQRYLLPENYSVTTGNNPYIYHWINLIKLPHSNCQPDITNLTYSVKRRDKLQQDNGKTIFLEVATISDDEDDIYKLIPKQTGLNRIWLSLTGLPCNPSTEANPVKNANNPLTTPTGFDLDGCTTPNTSNPVIVEEAEDKQPTTISSEVL